MTWTNSIIFISFCRIPLSGHHIHVILVLNVQFLAKIDITNGPLTDQYCLLWAPHDSRRMQSADLFIEWTPQTIA